MSNFESDARNLHEWDKAFIAWHDLEKPFAPENGQALRFKVGDKVLYKYAGGATFPTHVTGIYRPDATTTSYANGGRYFLHRFFPPIAQNSLLPLDEDSADTQSGTEAN